MPSLRDNIIEILISNKCLTKEQLDEALDIQKREKVPLKNVLVKRSFISEEDLLTILSKQLYIPRIHLDRYKFDFGLLKLIPEHIASQYNIIPLSRMGNHLTVAISDPLNIFALDDLKALTSMNIDTVLSSEHEIAKAIGSAYQAPVTAADEKPLDQDYPVEFQEEQSSTGLVSQETIELTNTLSETSEEPIIKLVNLMLIEALKKRASDIHLEPEFNCLRVRYRIDGALHEAFKIPKKSQNAVTARVKIISELNITESRIPQDGRFKVRFNGREIDFRVSALPITFGQKFVLRVLDKGNLSIGLDELGFSEGPLSIFKQAVEKPFGMLLVTGPTGSGKSTTLYSVLNRLNTNERNIVTVEDPVEYQIEGITQIPVNPEIGLTFASGLRSILRQSPDVIMVGEIRDSETADIAIKAALTGQLVLSTLHTNDAISSVTRLIDMGIEPFLVSSSLIMLSAQRLCRRLCSRCKKPQDIPLDLKEALGSVTTVCYTASGCKYCSNTGFYGRIAILEAVMLDDALREMIIKKSPLDEMKKYAMDHGMSTLRKDAFLKVKLGLTSLDEALRVTAEE